MSAFKYFMMIECPHTDADVYFSRENEREGYCQTSGSAWKRARAKTIQVECIGSTHGNFLKYCWFHLTSNERGVSVLACVCLYKYRRILVLLDKVRGCHMSWSVLMGSMLGGCVNMVVNSMNICPLFIQNPQLLRTVADYISRDVFLLIARSRHSWLTVYAICTIFGRASRALRKCNLTDWYVSM